MLYVQYTMKNFSSSPSPVPPFIIAIFSTLARNNAEIRIFEDGKESRDFVFIDNVLPPLSASMAYLYEHMKSQDGFLYIYYNGESTFGNKYVQ